MTRGAGDDLKRFLFEEYGGFGDKRIKNISKER
jgi:hypothetical protein